MRLRQVRLVLSALLAAAELPCDTPDACEPVIFVPGIMGSRLRQHARAVGSINTVSRHIWLPESHRLLQRMAAGGAMTATAYREWTNSLNPLFRQAGVRIEPDRTNWGLKGVACILKTGRECVATAKVFWDMILQLERAGYRAGVTLYGVPYDCAREVSNCRPRTHTRFMARRPPARGGPIATALRTGRYPPNQNKLCADLARTLHHITNTTGARKAVLVAHSLGNLQLLYCFQKVFGVETTAKVRSLVSIAAPWAGAPQVVRVLFSGAEMVSRFIISDHETRDFARQMPSVHPLRPEP